MARHAAVQLGKTHDIASFPEPTAANLPAFRWIADVFLTDAGACRKSVDARTGFAAKSREKQRMSALLAVLQGETAITDLLCSVRKLPDPRFREEQWAVLNAALDILPQAVHELRMTFAEHGKVDFAEIALRALETLGADEPTDLGLILGSRIAHLLMDEFQDTSVLQFELARRLTAGWDPGDGRTLFLVGDPMQSIYRFRQAEVGLFLKARHSGIGDVGLQPLSLSVNFRSDPAIVDWVNQTFTTVFPAREDIAAGAVPYSASTPHETGSAADAVVVHPFLQRDDAAEADLVLELVRRAIREDSSATTAILVRARTHLPVIAGRLRDNGVPFRAVEIETLAERPAVQDLLALTRALLHRGDRLSWLAVLRAPYCGLTLADLHAIASTDRKASIRDLLERNAGQVSVDGRRRLDRVMPVLGRGLSFAGRIPLRELVESTWVALGGPHALKAEADLDDALAYLDLLAAADAGGDLPSFELFNERIERLFAHPDPEAGEAVQLMTIHKAKGLEFDNVILPGLGKPPAQDDAKLLVWVERNGPEGGELLISPSSPRRGSDSICSYVTDLDREKGRQESARLLYVGCTRAKHRLDLIGHTFVTKSGELHEPDSESLLKVLWPAVEPIFRRKLERVRSEAATKQQPEATRPARPIRRLSSAWDPLPMPEPAQWAGSLPEARGASTRSAFEGVEAVHRHVGTVVHRLLERVAREGPDQWNCGTGGRHPARYSGRSSRAGRFAVGTRPGGVQGAIRGVGDPRRSARSLDLKPARGRPKRVRIGRERSTGQFIASPLTARSSTSMAFAGSSITKPAVPAMNPSRRSSMPSRPATAANWRFTPGCGSRSRTGRCGWPCTFPRSAAGASGRRERTIPCPLGSKLLRTRRHKTASAGGTIPRPSCECRHPASPRLRLSDTRRSAS